MKKTIMISCILAMIMMFPVICRAEVVVEEEELTEENDVFTNGQLGDNFIDYGEKDGFITTVDGEKYYINDYKRYYGYQKVYSMDVFNFFKETFDDLFQYVQTDSGYIVCEPAYRINLQNQG